jgi:hypothetical protein
MNVSIWKWQLENTLFRASDGSRLEGSGKNYTGQQNLTLFVPRGKISNPDSIFNAEFKYVSSFSPSPTVVL